MDKYKFSYRDNYGRKSCELSKDDARMVKNYKDDLFEIIKVSPEFIALKYRDDILDNDKCLSDYNIIDGADIIVLLEVDIREMHKNSNGTNICHKFLMEYDGSVRELRNKYCTEMHVETVLLTNGGSTNDCDRLITLLSDKDCIFRVYGAVKVRIEGDDTREVDAFENDKIKIVRERLNVRESAVLMIGNAVLKDNDQLGKYGRQNPFIISLGSEISLCRVNGEVTKRIVNNRTTIAELIAFLVEEYCPELSIQCLMSGHDCLDENGTIGSCGIKEGDSLQIIENIKILIKDDSDRKIMEYFVKKGETILDVKREVSEKLSADIGQITLSLDDHELRDGTATDSLTINKRSSIIVVVVVEERDHDGAANQMSVSEHTNSVVRGDNAEEPIRHTDSFTNVRDETANQIHLSEHTDSSNTAGRGEDCPIDGDADTIVLTVLNTNGDSVHISINKHCSVEHLREEISRSLKTGLRSIDILYAEHILSEGSIDKYNIENADTLILLPMKERRINAEEQFIINVVNPKINESYRYLIGYTEIVASLKRMLSEQYNVNVNRITLWRDDKEWIDGDVIRDMDIENGSTVILTVEEKTRDNDGEEIIVRVVNRLNDDGGSVCYDMTVCSDDTIESLRQQINTLFDLSSESYVMSYRGDIMKNENTVSTYNIENGGEIIISHSLLIRYIVGGDYTFAKMQRYVFEADDKVSDLLTKIEKKNNIETRLINLSFNGEFLDKNRTMREAGVENESCLMMVATLAGGG